MYFSYSSVVEFGTGRTIKQLPQASPYLSTALIQSTTTFKASHWIIFKDYATSCLIKNTNENDGYYRRISSSCILPNFSWNI